MSPRHCACALALMALVTPLSAQGAPAPAAGMAIRWRDASGPHNGTITMIMPDGSYRVDLRDRDGRELASTVGLDPGTTPDVEVRIAHWSRRGVGAFVGGAAGFSIAMASTNPKPYCNDFDHWLGCTWGRIALVFCSTAAGAAAGGLIAGERSEWIPVAATPTKEKPGVTVQPLVTWHDGPAVGLRVRF